MRRSQLKSSRLIKMALWLPNRLLKTMRPRPMRAKTLKNRRLIKMRKTNSQKLRLRGRRMTQPKVPMPMRL